MRRSGRQLPPISSASTAGFSSTTPARRIIQPDSIEAPRHDRNASTRLIRKDCLSLSPEFSRVPSMRSNLASDQLLVWRAAALTEGDDRDIRSNHLEPGALQRRRLLARPLTTDNG